MTAFTLIQKTKTSSTVRCDCCGCLLTTKNKCPLCDMEGLVSPPHMCLKTGKVLTDEHGCSPEEAEIERFMKRLQSDESNR